MVGLNSQIVEFGTIGQAYGLCLLASRRSFPVHRRHCEARRCALCGRARDSCGRRRGVVAFDRTDGPGSFGVDVENRQEPGLSGLWHFLVAE